MCSYVFFLFSCEATTKYSSGIFAVNRWVGVSHIPVNSQQFIIKKIRSLADHDPRGYYSMLFQH